MQFIIDLMLLSIYAFFTISIFAYIRRFWVMYMTQKFATDIVGKTIMLEIKLPREIDKSPLAMEMVISNMNQTSGTSTWYTRGIDGAQSATFSLEIASLEGVVHFYIRTQKKFKELLSASLYAHYPGVEVIEVEDYTSQFPRYEHNKKDQAAMWGNGFKLSKEFTLEEKGKEPEKIGFFAKWLFWDTPNPDKAESKDLKLKGDALPIRTYVDLGLDKQKEEMKVDPLVGILEYFGSLGKGEYAALQIIVQDAGIHDDIKAPGIYYHPETHKIIKIGDLAKFQKEALRGKKTVKAGEKIFDKYGNPEMDRTGEVPVQKTYGKDITDDTPEVALKTETKAQLELIERKISKPLLACVMRAIYVTKPKSFRVPNIMHCLALMKPFNAPGFNTFGFGRMTDPYDYDWQKMGEIRTSWRNEEIFEAFVEREGFYPHTGLVSSLTADPKGMTAGSADRFFFKYKMSVRKCVAMIAEGVLEPFGHPHTDEVFVMNTEELATLYHLPGLVASVPTLPRIDSRKAVAPVNLPV